MTDARDFWRTWWKYRKQTLALQQRTFHSSSLRIAFTHVLAVAPVVENRGFFELFDGDKPPKSYWRWLIAVRTGLTGDPLLDAADIIDIPTPQREALFGFEIDDVIACSQDMKKVTARQIGDAVVCGWPQHPYLADRGQPIRVRENPLAWLLARGDGVFFCGRDADVGQYLKECESGVLVSTVAMGEAMEIKMKRAGIARPRILVDA